MKSDIKEELIKYIKEDLEHCSVSELNKVYKMIRRLRHGQSEDAK